VTEQVQSETPAARIEKAHCRRPVVEAAEVEPAPPQKANWLMARDSSS